MFFDLKFRLDQQSSRSRNYRTGRSQFIRRGRNSPSFHALNDACNQLEQQKKHSLTSLRLFLSESNEVEAVVREFDLPSRVHQTAFRVEMTMAFEERVVDIRHSLSNGNKMYLTDPVKQLNECYKVALKQMIGL